MRRKYLIAALCGLLPSIVFCPAARAGGSVAAEDVLKILRKNQTLWSYLDATVEFSESAWGVRCGSHWPFMSGMRIAPYTIEVKPKAGGRPLVLTVECEQHFFDKDGIELPWDKGEIGDEIIKKAVRVEEKARFVTLRAVE